MERNECAEILTKLANTKINSIMKISKKNQERLNCLNGIEINSLKYEGVVCIRKDYNNTYYVIQYGKVIDWLTINSKINNIWDEYILTEVQYY